MARALPRRALFVGLLLCAGARPDYATPETFDRLANETVSAFAGPGGAACATFTGTLEAMRLAPNALAVAMLAGCAANWDPQLAPFCVGETEGLELTKQSRLGPVNERGAVAFKATALMATDARGAYAGRRDLENDDVIFAILEGVRSRRRIYPRCICVVFVNPSPTGLFAQLNDSLSPLGPDVAVLASEAGPSHFQAGTYGQALRFLAASGRPRDSDLVVLTGGRPLRSLYKSIPKFYHLLPSCTKIAASEATDIGRACCLDGNPRQAKPEVDCATAVARRFDAALAAAGAPALECDDSAPQWVHASFVASGAFARDVLAPAFSESPRCKVDEALNSIWTSAAIAYHGSKSGINGGCGPIDSDVPLGPRDHSNYFLYKQHGGAKGWGQHFPAAVIRLALDQDADGGQRKTAHQNFCAAVLHDKAACRRGRCAARECLSRIVARVRGTCASDGDPCACAAVSSLPRCHAANASRSIRAMRREPNTVDIFAPLRRGKPAI
ncbi:hypothetical protein M885DRAFT_576352 [Pelagophyceae sp. CCMP2097]|nr:hypothetical protein M885DRAFT_576352 [Pelagophyceae sp. CCMP2097]